MRTVLITSSILIPVIAALRPILRGRSSPMAQYALWLIVAVRLLVPWEAAPSAYSALALLERAEEPARLAETIGQTAVPLPGMSYEDAYDRALREYNQDRPLQTSFTDLEEVERRARELQASSPTLAEIAEQYARPVWLGGAALMGLWFLLVNLRLRRKLRFAPPVEADCPLPVRVSPELPSPCLCGAVRPVIYVTPDALADPDRARHVLAHELTHYRHKDHWWALARCLCLCLYWFDPLVWWAAAMSRQDCELACDAGAIRRLGEEERIPYGRTLVAMIASGRNSLLQTATTMTGGKRRVKERVELIARRPKTAAALIMAAALLLGLTACFTFTGAPEAPEETPSWDQPTEDVEPFEPEQTTTPRQVIQTAVERLLAGPMELSLAPAGSSRVYVYPYQPGEDSYWDGRLRDLDEEFLWEEAVFSTSLNSDILSVSSRDGMTALSFAQGSFLMMVEQDKEFHWYKGRSIYGGDITPYDGLRWLFDEVELTYLRSTTVPDRGQSHEEIVREWTENWEGAMTKTAPGSQYACTYVRIENIRTNHPEFPSREALEEFVQGRNFSFSADDFGKTWFGFIYDTVFVPVDQNTSVFWAGNTREYEGGGAPEGALIYHRVGYIWLTGEGWTCAGVGTG